MEKPASYICLCVTEVTFLLVRLNYVKIDVDVHLIPIKNYPQI
jgi:hypothetical protein